MFSRVALSDYVSSNDSTYRGENQFISCYFRQHLMSSVCNFCLSLDKLKDVENAWHSGKHKSLNPTLGNKS